MGADSMGSGGQGPVTELAGDPGLPPLDMGFATGVPPEVLARTPTPATFADQYDLPQSDGPLADAPVVEEEQSPLPEPEPSVETTALAVADPDAGSDPVADDTVEAG